jgi:glycogen debranching enzyme
VQISLDKKAQKIMRTNDRGSYTVPTAGLYPYQWNWDSAFAALGFATFDLERAWVELETLFSGQWSNGMLPHIIFHKSSPGYFPGPDEWGTEQNPKTSGISQPPVAASFARMIYEKDKQLGRVHIEALFPKIMAWHRWFFEHRNEKGMIVINHPWESGRDNAPDWDEAMQNVDISNVGEYIRNDLSHVDPHMRPQKEDYDRFMAIVYFARDCAWNEEEITKNGPFRVADPGMTFILLRANRDLLALAKDLGQPSAEIENWIAIIEAGVQQLWNEKIGAYDAKNIRTGNFANSLSSASFLCWYGGVKNQKMLEAFERVSKALDFSVPSHDPASEKFEPFRYWRGPVWGVVNSLIGMGLKDMGYIEQAEKIRSDTARLITKSGFAEYYNPEDGSPAGGKDFTWTAAVWLAWASPSAIMERD